ncbi:MAG TPA: DNA polymerase III subunit delta' [Gammaproteobacteria bacterium]|nr:DNA polymerase III subunit delta' [Gammaproteobacteria bacterium]
MIFSWQVQQWEQLCRLQKEERLPHALLFTGPSGIGKRRLALTFARLVLCQQIKIKSLEYFDTLGVQGCQASPQRVFENRIACGRCHACCLMQAESHPDFRLVQPEQEDQAIKIDLIRELNQFISQTAHHGGYRVVLIQPATAMNTAAANALLKTLEEPAPRSLFILISDGRTKLPATIRSRCQELRFSLPSGEAALNWLASQDPSLAWEPLLAATQGAPLLAQSWHREGVWPLYQQFMNDLAGLTKQEVDPFQMAVQWKDTSLLWIFDLFFQWLLKLMRIQAFPDQAEDSLSLLSNRVSKTALLEFIDYLQQLRVEALGPYNLNQQLLLESLFIRWIQYVSR